VDKRRVIKIIGQLEHPHMAEVASALRAVLEL
jgi:hypothetical protein